MVEALIIPFVTHVRPGVFQTLDDIPNGVGAPILFWRPLFMLPALRMDSCEMRRRRFHMFLIQNAGNLPKILA